MKELPKSELKEIKIEGGRTIPSPSNSLKPKEIIKPKEKK
jgi:hypothetical protein